MVIYVPGTEETDPKKQNMSLQAIAGAATTAITNVAANTAAIAALNAATYVNSIATRTGAITLNATSGITNSSNDVILSQASSSQFGAVKVDGTTITAASGVISTITPGAWITYAPTVTAASGTFTTVNAAGSYQQTGKTVSFICTVTITTVGSAAGNVIVPLPVGTLKRAFATYGVETALTGKGINVFGVASASSLSLNQTNTATTLAASGAVLTFSGTYEST